MDKMTLKVIDDFIYSDEGVVILKYNNKKDVISAEFFGDTYEVEAYGKCTKLALENLGKLLSPENNPSSFSNVDLTASFKVIDKSLKEELVEIRYVFGIGTILAMSYKNIGYKYLTDLYTFEEALARTILIC